MIGIVITNAGLSSQYPFLMLNDDAEYYDLQTSNHDLQTSNQKSKTDANLLFKQI